jgi:hypothetical protein
MEIHPVVAGHFTHTPKSGDVVIVFVDQNREGACLKEPGFSAQDR